MALFFDSAWFDEKLAAHGLTRADAARALGLSDEETAELWKDQREVLPAYVSRLALLLGEPEDEVCRRAGIQGPPLALRGRAAAADAPAPPSSSKEETALGRRLGEIESRLARIEAALERLLKRRQG